MKKWLLALGIIILLVGAYLLNSSGIIRWQPLTMIIAAIAGPVKLFTSILGLNADKIRKEHEETRGQEHEYQAGIEGRVQTSTENIGRINQQIEVIDQEIDALRRKRELVERQVAEMSTREKQQAGQQYFGN
jgi:hypothetical protein